MTERLFYTRTEAAGILRCDSRTIDRGIEQGLIPAVRIAASTTRWASR